MKIIDKTATYIALILISSLPLSVDACAELEKKSNPAVLTSTDDDLMLTDRKQPKNNR